MSLVIFYLFIIIIPWIPYKKLLKTNLMREGKKLEIQLRDLILNSQLEEELATFKFYTSITQKLLSYRRKLGSPITDILKDLRQELRRDIKFEIKRSQHIREGYMQMGLITIVTWGFISLSVSMTGIEKERNHFINIIIMQSLGCFCYATLERLIERKLFEGMAQYLESLYLFKIFLKVGMSSQLIISESSIGEIIDNGKFSQINGRLSIIIESWRLKGVPIQNDVREIIEELWYIRDELFTKFLKYIQVLRFIIIVGFFLSAYFLHLFGLISGISSREGSLI